MTTGPALDGALRAPLYSVHMKTTPLTLSLGLILLALPGLPGASAV